MLVKNSKINLILRNFGIEKQKKMTKFEKIVQNFGGQIICFENSKNL